MYQFNPPYIPYDGKMTVLDLFDKQVWLNPSSVAIVFEEERLTYAELNVKSNQLCNYILSSGVTEGECIGVLLERSLWSVLCMLSVLRLGCIYVPIDDSYPSIRIEQIIKKSGITFLLRDSSNSDFSHICPNIVLFPTYEFLQNENSKDLKTVITANQSSYIIHTSGSTGQPKGIEQSHLTLFNLINWAISDNSSNGPDKYLQFSSFNFDMSIYDVFYSLCTGSELHILSNYLRSDMFGLRKYIKENNITIVSIPCAILRTFFDRSLGEFLNHQLSRIICAGEQLFIIGGIRDFLLNNPNVMIQNLYGPSETHVVTGITYSFSNQEIPEKASIGRPVDNTNIYILDKHMNLAPIGVEGEIYIGGMHVAKGYRGLPDLTEERFLKDIYFGKGMMYRSGDVGRWDSNGNIEYLRREDDQVKINGYRVELEEIEIALRGFNNINEAVVSVSELDSEERELVAYIETSELFDINEIKKYLLSYLPGYMVPNKYVFLEKLPIGPTGKIDKRNLPEPEKTKGKRREYVAARNELEMAMVEIWQSILKHDSVGINDDFFELGGDSIRITKLIMAVRKRFNINLKFEGVLMEPTISALMEAISLDLWLNTSKIDDHGNGYDEIKL
ncbi:non-ribosomal peptide synthetase [Pedobacter roseus]|uniref:Non-ribosomal peptide synthetase n=1 Tax=Pedobacter roseus TaxID=336820 RepID=A0A7G9QKR9_9SPHI|nr:non-ribosomal peptide synthetase [Pedobacter roseus]QNN43944.1 non-ribosomal peptide synthetase [Pedobacter roseus]